MKGDNLLSPFKIKIMKKALFFYYFSLLSTVLLIASCKQKIVKYTEFDVKTTKFNSSSFNIDKNDVKFIPLKSEKIHGLFTEIAVVDSLLICGNLRSQKLVNIYSLNSGKLINELIGKGGLQNEGLSVSSIYIQQKNLWIYDITLCKLFKIDLYDKKEDSLTTEKIDLSKNLKNIISPSIINDSLILATSYSIDSFRYLYANPQKITKKIGQLPEVKNSEYLIDIPKAKFPNKAFIFKAISIKHPSEDKVAIFYNKADRIEFYSNDKLIKILQNQESFSPIMEVSRLEEGGFTVEDSDKTKYAYLSTAYTKNYIYSLYSGNNETSSNSILVFDWNGQFIRKIELDRKVCKICIDEKRNILYCYENQSNGIHSANLNFDL